MPEPLRHRDGAPSCNRIHLALDFQELCDFAPCLLDITPEAEGRREFQMNVPDARRKRPRSSKRFHGFNSTCLGTTTSRPPCATPGRMSRTCARLWRPSRSHNHDTQSAGGGGKVKVNLQFAPIRPPAPKAGA